MILQLLRKEIYLSFLLSILLFVSIDILSYNHIVLGKEDTKDDNKNERGGREEAEEEAEDFEDITIKELFDDDNEDDVKEEEEEEEGKEEEDVPFRLPFRAVPFP